MTDYENMELRSEKVRNIIGQVPPELATGGTVYIILLLVFLLAATAAIPYPETITAEVNVTYKDWKEVHAEALVPYRFITRIGKGMDIQVDMEGYTAREYGYSHGKIEAVEDSIISRDGENYFRIYLQLRHPMKYEVKQHMQGVANITVTNRSILQYIIWK